MSYSLNQWQRMGKLQRVDRYRLFVVDSDPSAHKKLPVLLLLHGFPTAGWDWHRQWDALTCVFRVIAPDMLGFGFSDKPQKHDYRIVEQADLLETLLQDKGIEQCAILAHDYGDTVAQEFLARDATPSRRRVAVASACLLNGGLFPETHRARAVQKLLIGPAGPLLVRFLNRGALKRNMQSIFGKRTQPQPDELDNFWALIEHNGGRLVMHRLLQYINDRILHRERWVEALRTAQHKTGLINGSADPVSGAHMVMRYRQLIGDNAIVELPTIGHYPQLESPDEVLHHVLSFFANVGHKDAT